MLAAFWLWAGAERPRLLISDSGGLVGVMTETGRALSKPRGGGFVAGIWLENDGEAATQPEAHARWHADLLAQVGVMLVAGKAAARQSHECGAARLIVFTAEPEAAVRGTCRVVTPGTLRTSGSLALIDKAGGLHLQSAADVTGHRLWSPQ